MPSSHPRRWLRRTVILLGTVLGLTVFWLISVRSTASMRAVRIVEDKTRPAAPVPDNPVRLRIATWGIGRGDTAWRGTEAERLDEIAGILADERPDVVILNDCDLDGDGNAAQRIAERAGFRWWVEQRNVDTAIPGLSWRRGNAVLSRYRIGAASQLDDPAYSVLESVIAGHNRSLLCEVEVHRHILGLIAVDMDERSAELRQQASELIADVVTNTPLTMIVAGNFCTPAPGQWGFTPGGGSLTMSGLLRPSAGGRGERAAQTYPAEVPTRRTDWVLVPTHWRVLSSRVVDVRLSDHRPVIVDLEAGEW